MIHSLVQLSDLHIRAPGTLAYGRVDTADFLRRAVATVLALKQAPDAVVITGDLTDFGRADEYALLRELLRPLACPLYPLPGNHDDRDALRRCFAELDCLQAAGPFVQYAVKLGGVRLVSVDTVVPGASHGEVCEARVAQLDTLLAQDRDTPTIVAMHHPPFRTQIGHMDDIGLLRGEPALRAVIERHLQVRRVICGHLHRAMQTTWAGTLALTAPSPAHQVCFDLDAQAPSAFTMEPPGLLVHAWDAQDSGHIVSHVVPCGSFDGPFPFHEGDGRLID